MKIVFSFGCLVPGLTGGKMSASEPVGCDVGLV